MKKLMMAVLLMMGASLFAKEVDLSKSVLMWQGTKVTGRHWGDIKIKSAKVTLEKDELKSAEFVVDMATFNAFDLSGEWKEKFTTHLKSEDFFEVSKYPTAKLILKEVKGLEAVADLTIKGVTQEVSFPFTKHNDHLFGTLVFDRTKFGLKYGSKSFFKSIGDKAIDDKVTLIFDVYVK